MFKKFTLLLAVLLIPISYASEYSLCSENKGKQSARSNEIHNIYLADQKDRENWNNLSREEMFEVQNRDLSRRKRIGEIFGEGCLNSAADFINAAMIYQCSGLIALDTFVRENS